MAENTEMNKTVGKRIKEARKRQDMSQEQLGEKLGVSFQAVSTWERGKNLPDSAHLPVLAKELDVSLDALFAEREKKWRLKPVNSDPDRTFTFVKGRAQTYGLKQSLAVMNILREAYADVPRRSKYGFGTKGMIHPLTMACNALALGLRDDDVIASCLAHGLVDDACMKTEELPVGERVREVVRLLSKAEVPWSEDWEEPWYGKIARNPLACLTACLDRIHNLSGMADAFDRERMIRYIRETDRYYPDLLEEIRDVPEWNDAWWLMQYQLRALLETFKRML